MPGISIGNGGYSMSAAPNPVMGLLKKEDACFAIANVVLASRPTRNLSEFVQWCERRETDENCVFDVNSASTLFRRRPLNPFAVESFAQALFRRLGIRTAATRIVTWDEARKLLPDSFVVKYVEIRDGKMRAAFGLLPRQVPPDVFCLASEIVPDAVTIDFLWRKFKIAQGRGKPDARIDALATRHAENSCRKMTEFFLGKQCPEADTLYQNFDPSYEELRKIKAAIRWDGDAYLRICAARTFLSCSAAHGANALASRSGELISIDHCGAYRESGDDLRMLFQYVNRKSAAFGVLGQIAELQDQDVCAASAEIPRHSVCGPVAAIADYFTARLRLWRSLYEAAPTCAVASAAV